LARARPLGQPTPSLAWPPRRYYFFLFCQTYSKLYLLSQRRTTVRVGAAPGGGLRTALGINPYRYHDAATAAVKYGNTHDPLAILGDRAVGNTLEQLVPFVGSLWLYALTVGPQHTAITGWTYVASRALYPPLFWAGSPYILLATVPGYLVIWFHLGATLHALILASQS
jgi:uncharacterized MAPEG superfamily protein